MFISEQFEPQDSSYVSKWFGRAVMQEARRYSVAMQGYTQELADWMKMYFGI